MPRVSELKMKQEEQPLIRIVAARVREGFEVKLRFSDGTEKIVDLEPYLHGTVFEPLRRDPSLFGELSVDEELGTIVWPNGADLDPDVLYAGGTPIWAQGKEGASR